MKIEISQQMVDVEFASLKISWEQMIVKSGMCRVAYMTTHEAIEFLHMVSKARKMWLKMGFKVLELEPTAKITEH